MKKKCSNRSCAHKGVLQSSENFHFRGENPTKLRSQCRDCEREYRAKNREKIRARVRRWQDENKEYRKRRDREKNYGLTHAEYTSLKKKQKSRCAICERKVRVVVDHCHKTHKVRGLLCQMCNRGLGLFRDNTKSLARAKSYVEVGS